MRGKGGFGAAVTRGGLGSSSSSSRVVAGGGRLRASSRKGAPAGEVSRAEMARISKMVKFNCFGACVARPGVLP